ncbi:hypothetical protein LAJ19_12900 [Deinococcus taeanensis]|uniref:hypothetical protein n=1 Tax=Deinococcus taeanensis TaxID=2737050 RepID=UPI001CDCCB3B|nr:hypothetical protein [Deinococcus taeanensis]UBV42508.1 hypothetical protein LAJ19_12900 [Deinococcus taeanensis]
MKGLLCVILLLGTADADAFPALTHVEQVHPPSGQGVEVRRVACSAPGRPVLAAALTLEPAGALSWQVVQLETNEAGAEVLAVGRTLPQIQPHYARYVTRGAPVGRVTFTALVGTWKLFGLKFSWQDATYRCVLS